MAGSRTAHNAKLVQRHQRQQSNELAKSSANKFTRRQSHFERRREEEQVRQQSAAMDGSINTTTVSVGDGLLVRAVTRSGGSGGGRYTPAMDDDVRETPNPFARSRNPTGGNTAALSTSTRSAVMGLPKAVKSTRTTRRIHRFNLSGDGGGTGEAFADTTPSSLMGVRRVREGEPTGLDELSKNSGVGDTNSDSGAAPPRTKRTRAEKFREIISSSKGQRAQLQKERAERDAATLQLDAEINSLLHLLPKRSKTEDAQAAFAQSGTPEVQALLASYRRGHEAKCLTLKSSGAFEVRNLAEAARVTFHKTGDNRNEQQTTLSARATPDQTDPTAPVHSRPAFLDAADRALLDKIRSGAARSTEEEDEEHKRDAVRATTKTTITADLSRQVTADFNEARTAPLSANALRDDFDSVLRAFQLDPRRAHAVSRTLTEEEEAAQAAQQALLREDRQQVPSLNLQERDQMQLTRGEWVEQGGDMAFTMEEARGEEEAEEDNVDIPSSFEGDSDADDVEDAEESLEGDGDGEEKTTAVVKPADRMSGSQALDRLLEDLEKLATTATTEDTRKSKQQRLHALLVQLHRHATNHVMEAAKAFRLILVEAERSFLRGTRHGGLRRTLLVYLYAITKVFPASDYRHEVMTPFLIFVCSVLMQAKLVSLEAVHSYLVLTTLLLHCLKAGAGRYCAEVVVASLNVLALQLPRVVLEPVRYQGSRLAIPLMDRPEAALLHSSSSASIKEDGEAQQNRPPYQIGLLDTVHDPQQLLLCAYHIYDELCELYRTTPAFPVMCATPFLRFDALLLQPHNNNCSAAACGSVVEPWKPSPEVRLAHEALAVKVRDMAKAVQHHRTPLAMRTFRPRPIRQFDPLLAEREENALKNEVRVMKRDIREDKKRLMRHLTAEATVQRRAQEKRAAVDDAQREKRYHTVLHQLQQQQHSMNTVESLKSRAKAAKKKGISGESNVKPVSSGDPE